MLLCDLLIVLGFVSVLEFVERACVLFLGESYDCALMFVLCLCLFVFDLRFCLFWVAFLVV